jgi:hypothetical protein
MFLKISLQDSLGLVFVMILIIFCNTSLVRQYTVEQSFSCVFTTQIIDSFVPPSDESVRNMRPSDGLKLGSPALDAVWVVVPKRVSTVLQKKGERSLSPGSSKNNNVPHYHKCAKTLP